VCEREAQTHTNTHIHTHTHEGDIEQQNRPGPLEYQSLKYALRKPVSPPSYEFVASIFAIMS